MPWQPPKPEPHPSVLGILPADENWAKQLRAHLISTRLQPFDQERVTSGWDREGLVYPPAWAAMTENGGATYPVDAAIRRWYAARGEG